MPRYFQDHRRHRRVAVHATAEVRLPTGEAFSYQVVNASSTGLCLRGNDPIAFDVAGGVADPQRFTLNLALPAGRVAGGLEAVQVWETRQGGQVVSGWRFVSLPADSQALLEAEVGVAPPVPEERPAEAYGYYDDEVELWDYVEVLVRRRWVIAGCTAVALIASIVYASRQPALYEARAQILPVGEVDYLSQREAIVETSSKTPFIAILESLPVKRTVAARTYALTFADSTVRQTLVDYLYEQAESPPKPDLLSDAEWQRRLEASALGWLGANASFKQKADKVIDITCKALHPELAAQVANAYVDEIRDYLLRSAQGYARQNIAMAEARLDTLSREVEQAERELEVYRAANQQLLRDTVDVPIAYPEVATKDAQLNRAVQLKQSLYNTVASQYELLRLQRSKNVAGVEVVAEAEPPLGYSKSNKAIPLGTILGLFVGIFSAFGMEYVAGKRKAGGLGALAEAWQHDTAWFHRLRPR